MHALTPAELTVLRHLANGLGRNAIADQLWVSPWTVQNHCANLYRKLGVTSMHGAVAVGFRQGLVR